MSTPVYPGDDQPDSGPASQSNRPDGCYRAGRAGYPGYSGQPGYASDSGGGSLPPTPPRPLSVTAAFWCWIAGIGSSLLGLLLYLTSPIWTLALEYVARTDPGPEIPSLLNLLKIVLVVAYLIGAGLYLFFALKMFGGRNWGRITLTVLGVLGVAVLLTPFASSVTVDSQTFVGSQAPGYVTAVLTVAVIVLMFVGGANRYFAASLAHRGQFR